MQLLRNSCRDNSCRDNSCRDSRYYQASSCQVLHSCWDILVKYLDSQASSFFTVKYPGVCPDSSSCLDRSRDYLDSWLPGSCSSCRRYSGCRVCQLAPWREGWLVCLLG